MARLEIEFRGMCMHLSATDNPLPEGVCHRVVAINADQGGIVGEHKLPPHYTTLEMDKQFAHVMQHSGLPLFTGYPPIDPSLASFRLQRTRITVENAKGELTVDFRDVPHLMRYDPDMQLKPDLADRTVPEPDAACFVDLSHGCLWDSTFRKGGIYTVWAVETVGPPRLRFETEGQETTHVTIPSNGCRPVRLWVRNGSGDTCDEKFDFALYYLAAVGGIPKKFAHPLPGEPDVTGAYIDTTTSCSNSQYP